ncbi:lysis system i-spanin subunit Rz [Sodalis sp. (in: enterobacteria)]|uniref:lysis system i-spanin subunit Rz n=1 Tax=Sodalis sp. (in: enterobacteria) TaxID=1898979 RepID=UPI003F402149
MMHWKISIVIAALLASMAGAALYYRSLYLNAEQARQHTEAQAEAQHAALAQVNRQMQTVAALDSQHTRELENEKNRIAQLERDVAAGRRRLRLHAVCPNVSAGGTTTRVDDAARARLADAAERHYFTLRRRIEIAQEQINGLQDYVQQVCLNSHSGE